MKKEMFKEKGSTINIYLPMGEKDTLIFNSDLYGFDSVAQYVRFMCIEKADDLLRNLKPKQSDFVSPEVESLADYGIYTGKSKGSES